MTTPRALVPLALTPRSLGEDASVLDRVEFLARHGDATHLLLVRGPDGDAELELGFAAGASNGSARVAEPLPFRTAHQAPPRALRSDSDRRRREDPAALRALIEKHPCFAVPVRKRDDSGALFMGRISLGRARNNDIVLRHPSISKFHAWFEADESENLHVCDAGSTNLTLLNGAPVEARARNPVEAGDALRFGSIETVVCTPATLWASLGVSR
jgi:hypothetical protein